jgi:hypothetical protein
MKKLGAVIIFKSKVSKEQAEKWLRSISDRDTGIIEDPRAPVLPGYPPFNGVHEYDDMDGNCGPVWYIP